MKHTEINFIKVEKSKVMSMFCFIPADQASFEKFKLLEYGKEFKVKICPDREYKTHKFLWKMIDYAIESGISEKDCIIYDTDFILKREVVQAIYLEKGCDWVETWRKILQTLFLPKQKETGIDGQIKESAGSIKYEKLNEIEMKIFEDKVALFFSDNLNMTKFNFKMEAGKK
jgi:hypothetical protein